MSPFKRPESYISALSKAWDDLGALDPVEIAGNSGASYDTENGEFVLTFLGDEYRIYKSRTVRDAEGKDARPFIAVLLLHYLVYAKDIELEGKLISFRELEGGEVYYSAFQRRAIFPITKVFGYDFGAFKEAGKRLGAVDGAHGDISIRVDVFPKIPVTVILWKGDEEVPSTSNMLFDASIKELLPTEDVAVIGGFVASALIKNMKKRV